MATVNATWVDTNTDGPSCRVVKWTGINAGDTITAAPVGNFSDKTVQMYCANAFGGNMSLAGSCNPDLANAAFTTLTDANATAIATKTSTFIAAITEGCYWIKPVAAAGVSSVDVYLLLQSSR